MNSSTIQILHLKKKKRKPSTPLQLHVFYGCSWWASPPGLGHFAPQSAITVAGLPVQLQLLRGI